MNYLASGKLVSHLQVDIGDAPATGGNVFDDSDDEQGPASPAAAPVPEAPKPKGNKLAELASKKRKEVRMLWHILQAKGTKRHSAMFTMFPCP